MELNEDKLIQEKITAVEQCKQENQKILDEFKEYREMVDQELVINQQIRDKQNHKIEYLNTVIAKMKQIMIVPRLHTQYLTEANKIKSMIDSGEKLTDTENLYYLTPRLQSPEIKLITPKLKSREGGSRNQLSSRVKSVSDFSMHKGNNSKIFISLEETLSGVMSINNKWSWVNSSLQLKFPTANSKKTELNENKYVLGPLSPKVNKNHLYSKKINIGKSLPKLVKN